jgi:glycosyltransferase involved in cell wall biosynthesis
LGSTSGGRTFVATGVDFAGLMERNQQIYRRKWTDPEESGKSPVPTARASGPIVSKRLSLRVGDRGGLFLVTPTIRLSLCMIARDNRRTIAAAIESAGRCVDEIIVVDTGSVDDTPQIAANLGARVYHLPWCDDFSAARNESLKYARGDWVFWIDTDDTIDEENARKLRELPLDNLAPSVLGIVMQVHCPGSDDDGDLNMTVVDHVKLFRNLPELRFEFRIHEQILPAISRAGGEVVWSDIFVVHSGYDHSPEGQQRKLQRDLRILHLELTDRPNHPFTLFNLGMTYADIRKFDEAIGYLQRSVECSRPGETQLRKAYALLVHAFHQTQRIDQAWFACEQALELFPDDLELRFRRAISLQDRGRLNEAAETLHGILQKPEERHFTSVVAGLRGYKTRHNLAIVYEEMGDLARAEEQWRLITQEVPRYREGWLGLGDILLKLQRYRELEDLVARLESDGRLKSAGSTMKTWIDAVVRDNPNHARNPSK